MEAKRLFDLLTTQIERNPDNYFLASKIQNTWKQYTFKEVQDLADRVSQLLIQLDLHKDDKIAIISTNRPEWNFTDLGALQTGVTVVPMYPTISEHDYEYIFNDAQIKYAFISDHSIYEKVKPLLKESQYLKGIYSFDEIENATSFWHILPVEINIEEIKKRKESILEDELATIIYTSGTTGNPKGVMLTHTIW